jgi:hypothetical protein
LKLGPYLLGPNDTPENGIYCGDARELAKTIPDESVDLIFTDPPYPRKYLPLYGWLAKIAARILKPGSLCLAKAGQSYLPQILNEMEESLTYHWLFSVDTLSGESPQLWTRRINAFWKPIVSFSAGQYIGPWLGDNGRSRYSDKRFHLWGQSESSVGWLLIKLKGIVLDPFTGGGTVPAVCKMLGRRYLAFEIDPQTCELARERVQNTQPPLFIPQPEQVAMELAP